MNSKVILSYILPEGVLDFFEVTDLKDKDGILYFSLEELPLQESELGDRNIHSKGFYPEIEVQDFPIRGQACVLKVKRRRWTDLDTSQIFNRDWNLVASGTRLTSEFALFLNKVNRFKSD